MSAARWSFESGCPADWAAWLPRCDGGFFHSPIGLAASGLDGKPWYATLRRGTDVLGIAVGMWRRCRLSVRPRHVYLSTPPALTPEAAPERALAELVESFAHQGAADVVMDSFDQIDGWSREIAPPPAAALLPQRLEYIVRLNADADALLQRWSAHHRRQLSGIDAAGWTLRQLEGGPARLLLATVQHEAAARAADRGNGFAVHDTSVECRGFDARSPWGACLFSAWRGGRPLAAALVGWANRRAYYLQGGAMPEGYAAHASLWLHHHVIRTLAQAGFLAYSLGGTPASATLASSPAFGLHRFKTGFGPDVFACRGLQWNLRPTHQSAHRAVTWARGRWSGAGVPA